MTSSPKHQRVSLAEKRDLLRNSAIRVISQHGIDGASTRAITSEAGQNQASIHYAFDSKQDLLMSIPEAIQTDIQVMIATALDGCTDAPAAIQRLAVAYWTYSLADPDLQRTYYELTLFAISKGEYHDMAKAQYQKFRASITEVLSSFLADTMKATEIADLASACLAMIDGVILQYLATQDEAGCQRALDLGIRALQSRC